MGWAIKRLDGTYRSWYARAKSDERLLPGDTWEELPDMPALTLPPATLSALAQALDTALSGASVTPAQLKAVLQAWRTEVR